MRTIDVLSPAGEWRGRTFRLAPGLPSLEGRVVGLLDNNKSNSAEFLRLVGDDLRASHGVKEVVPLRKPASGKPAEPAVLERLRRCDFVVTAFAD